MEMKKIAPEPKQNFEAQLGYYVLYDKRNKKFVTLREFLRKRVNYPYLNSRMKSKIAKERIKQRPWYQNPIYSMGVINQQRAIQEIEKNSKLGKTLIKQEFFTIQFVLEEAIERIDKAIIEITGGA
jgi:hypothetical protein